MLENKEKRRYVIKLRKSVKLKIYEVVIFYIRRLNG